MPSTKQFGFKKRKLSGVKLGERVPQNHFLAMGPNGRIIRVIYIEGRDLPCPPGTRHCANPTISPIFISKSATENKVCGF
jgi:hypothetical protein